LVLRRVTSLAHRSLNPSIELSSKLLYHACANLQKVIGRILHIESLTNSTTVG
jgi:predicted trehalose synthase